MPKNQDIAEVARQVLRTSDELHIAYLELLYNTIENPEMYAPGALAMELHLGNVVWTLAFLERREAEFQTVYKDYRLRFRDSLALAASHYGAALEERAYGEVASVLMPAITRMGFIKAKQTNESEWAALEQFACDCAARDWSAAEIDGLLPSPSLLIGRSVWCFRPPGDAGWMYLDFVNENGERLLRDVRMPGGGANPTIQFTPLGRRLLPAVIPANERP